MKDVDENKNFNVKMPESVKKVLRQKAAEAGLSMAALINVLIMKCDVQVIAK